MSFRHRLGSTLNCDELNVTGGTIKRDGNNIQNVIEGTFHITSSNLAVVPYLFNWVEIGYVDIPYAGTWRLGGAVRFLYDCTDVLMLASWHTTSAAQGAAENCATLYVGNVGAKDVHFSPEAIVNATGPVRVYLNAIVEHVSGGNPEMSKNGGKLRAFRIA